jgi:flagellar motor switch protein FliN/FliY
MQLGPGSLLTLDRQAHEPCDILVNGRVVARGEIVTVGDQYGVRISEISPAS